MPIYTKTGDRGETGLFGSQRLPKSDPLIAALGTVDELNAVLGTVVAQIQDSGFKIQDWIKGKKRERRPWKEETKVSLEGIQRDLFTIGSTVAGYKSDLPATSRQPLATRVDQLERAIDQMWADMPPLQNFILPGGTAVSAQLHLARAVCRRAERKVVALRDKRLEINKKYLNRLSDYLFTLAVYLNHKSCVPETIWKAQ